MKVQELRIGNIVSIDNPECFEGLEGVPMLVTSIEETLHYKTDRWTHAIGLKPLNNEKYKYQESYAQFIHFIKPIVLNDDYWLKYLGFSFLGSLYELKIFRLNKFQVNFNLETRVTRLGLKDNASMPFIFLNQPKYLHQLQNLLFVLNNFKEYPLKTAK